MDWQSVAWARLADAAAGGLIILLLGSLAARLCREPVKRARLVVMTLVGGVIVPALGALDVVPSWSAGLLPTTELPARPVDRDPSGPAPTPLASAPTRMPTFASVSPDPETAPATRPDPAPPRVSSWPFPAIRTILLGSYAAATIGMALWWLLGMVLLGRISREARPVSVEIRDVFLSISGPEGERVILLEHDRIALPFTYTWIRPVILLPTRFCDGGGAKALRYALAHEWSHVEGRDAWAWNLACLSGAVLFYQPLFWWLRRQLSLCQDFLADARAAAEGSAEDYAAFLVQLARDRQSGTSLPSLGIGDRRSNLSRRIDMLVQDCEPMERRCRAGWSLAASAVAAILVVAASGLRLETARAGIAPAQAGKEIAAQEGPKVAGAAKPEGESLRYSGVIKDKDTGRPIAGATVVVRRSVLKSADNRVIQETRHTSGADGTYRFTIPPQQVAERFLYIELDVEHPDYATRAGFGYSLGMIRKNEGLGERPFFESVELRPAKAVTGRVVTPSGSPASGVKILAYSVTDKLPRGEIEYGSFARTTTDADGRFRVPITTPGRGVYWILPKDYAPEMHGLPDGKRGDQGTLTLKKGVVVTGRALDAGGKPLAGLLLKADRQRGNGPEFEALSQMSVSDAIERLAETDAEGAFTFAPLPQGTYRVMPTEYDSRKESSAGATRRDVPATFGPRTLTIKGDEAVPPLEIRATPSVVIEGQWLDSKGQPKSGWGSTVFGRIDGAFWYAEARPDAQGKFSVKVPRGVNDVELDISTNEHASARYRIGKAGPLTEGRRVKLGTLDQDVKGIEIVRYAAPIIVINATTRDGRQIKGFKATAAYAGNGSPSDARIHLAGGDKKTEAIQDEQNDGRYRTSQLLPDRDVNVTVEANGFGQASRKLRLPEGKIEELTLVLDPK